MYVRDDLHANDMLVDALHVIMPYDWQHLEHFMDRIILTDSFRDNILDGS